jgi:hypothetical protein
MLRPAEVELSWRVGLQLLFCEGIMALQRLCLDFCWVEQLGMIGDMLKRGAVSRRDCGAASSLRIALPKTQLACRSQPSEANMQTRPDIK